MQLTGMHSIIIKSRINQVLWWEEGKGLGVNPVKSK